MADYYSILHKTISGLSSNNAQTRQMVYAKARTAINKQLHAIDPPPGEEAIARQIELLEQAISTLEAEQAAAEAAATPAPAASEPIAPHPSVHQPPAAEPSASVPPASVPPAPEPLAQEPPAPAPPPSQVPPPPVSPVQESVGDPAPVDPATTQSVAADTPMTDAPQPPMPQVDRPAAPQWDAPAADTLATGQPAADVPPVPPPPAYDASLDALLDDADRGGVQPVGVQTVGGQDAGRQGGKPRKSSGGLAGIILSLVLIAVVGLGGYLLWRNKDPLLALIGAGEPAIQASAPAAQDGDGDTETAETAETAETEPAENTTQEPAAATEAPKEEARLGADGSEIAPEPRVITPQEPAATDSALASEGVTGQEQEASSPAGSEAEVSPVDETPSSEQADAGTDDATTPGVAQSAYLYEEGSGSSAATRDNAAVIWSLAQEAPAADLPPEAVIVGKLDVPGRGLTMDMRIRRNIDESLPASHLIELAFSTPPDFAGGNVDTLARFVMKADEQARGEPLVAVPARVMPGNFIIALNNLERARQSNEKLMVESGWIDIPLGYASGRRALVTLEKGAVGQQVFRDAFADWQSR